MKEEIERKFLVSGEFQHLAKRTFPVRQGYLSTGDNVVRVRLAEGKGWLTIKGLSTPDGLVRPEWETEIAPADAEALLKLCGENIIEKTRFIIPEKNGLIFEVDVFKGKNKGLTIAEIELPGRNHPFDKPSWLGKEITGDMKYYNVFLLKKPYSEWRTFNG